ncbi:unnamed protein product [Rotaria sp. Silwood2]|nr:unnamed protein product [Rotaria sp. Silwood2]CAF4696230.1 unnamed protein product [Rotaria sp. Silwood2]
MQIIEDDFLICNLFLILPLSDSSPLFVDGAKQAIPSYQSGNDDIHFYSKYCRKPFNSVSADHFNNIRRDVITNI